MGPRSENDDVAAKYAQEEDEKCLFKTAAAGGEVAIEDLWWAQLNTEWEVLWYTAALCWRLAFRANRFLYFLRAVQKSETAMCPPIVKMILWQQSLSRKC